MYVSVLPLHTIFFTLSKTDLEEDSRLQINFNPGLNAEVQFSAAGPSQLLCLSVYQHSLTGGAGGNAGETDVSGFSAGQGEGAPTLRFLVSCSRMFSHWATK